MYIDVNVTDDGDQKDKVSPREDQEQGRYV